MMGKTFRGPQRSQIAPKMPKRSKRKKILPIGARRIDRASKIAEMEKVAWRRGKDFDAKYYAMCYGKVAYKSEQETHRNNTVGVLTVPYQCDYCPYWHVGRRPKTDPLANPHLWPGKAPRKETNERIKPTNKDS